MKEIMQNIVSDVCNYLRVNEDLFFCSKYDTRVLEAKMYVSFFAYYYFKIPPIRISKYLGLTEGRLSKNRAQSVAKSIQYNQSCQMALDVNELIKIIGVNPLKEYSPPNYNQSKKQRLSKC